MSIVKHRLMIVVFVCSLILSFALVACTSSTIAPVTASPAPQAASKTPAAELTWSMDTDCASCHIKEAETLTNESCLLSMHSDQDCISCHSQEDLMARAHAKMSTDVSKLNRLKRTKVGSETCLECHGSWEDLSELTKDSTAVKDSEGTVINPHVVATVLNTKTQHDRVTCTSCHEMHTGTTAETVANSVCVTCHHMEVYKCGVCHD